MRRILDLDFEIGYDLKSTEDLIDFFNNLSAEQRVEEVERFEEFTMDSLTEEELTRARTVIENWRNSFKQCKWPPDFSNGMTDCGFCRFYHFRDFLALLMFSKKLKGSLGATIC